MDVSQNKKNTGCKQEKVGFNQLIFVKLQQGGVCLSPTNSLQNSIFVWGGWLHYVGVSKKSWYQ